MAQADLVYLLEHALQLAEQAGMRLVVAGMMIAGLLGSAERAPAQSAPVAGLTVRAIALRKRFARVVIARPSKSIR